MGKRFSISAITMKAFIIILFMSGIVCGDEPVKQSLPVFFEPIAAIRLPNVDMESCSLDEFCGFLNLRIAELDERKPGGISIVLEGFPPTDTVEQLEDGSLLHIHRDVGGKDYQAKDVSVDRLLKEMSKLYDVEFHVTDVGLVVTPVGKIPFPNARAKTGKIFFTYSHKELSKSE